MSYNKSFPTTVVPWGIRNGSISFYNGTLRIECRVLQIGIVSIISNPVISNSQVLMTTTTVYFAFSKAIIKFKEYIVCFRMV